jgi:biotin carboxyl carrier protein
MTGTIKEVLIRTGERIEPGRELFVVESMKMELPVEAEVGGTVLEVLVEVGQRVEQGQPLLRLA